MVPFLDLKQINLRQRDELLAALSRVLDSGWLVLGKETEKFEQEFARYCGAVHGIGVANGLDAMHLVLKAWGIGRVTKSLFRLTPTSQLGWRFHMRALHQCPLNLEATYNLDPAGVRAAITPRTKAVIPVHLYGQSAQIAELRAIIGDRHIKILEDAAQAHGASQHGRRAGALGDAAAFSFYPGKNLGALGDGGGITTNDTALADSIRILRNYGSRVKYHNEVAGYNSRLDELHSAFMLAKLPLLDADNERRAQIATAYNEAFASIDSLVLPSIEPGCTSVWHLYVVRHAKRDALARALSDHGVGSLIHYPIPPHLQPAYANLGFTEGSFPIAERIHREVLSLPIGPTMTQSDVEKVIEGVRAAVVQID